MSRTIAVKDPDGNDDYVVVEDTASPSFYLSTGEKLSLESAERFEDLNGFSYYAQEDADIDWLAKIKPER